VCAAYTRPRFAASSAIPPNIAFRIQRNGEYRVDVDPDGHATIIDVFQGRGEAIGGGNNNTVVANQHAVFSGDEDINYDIDPLPRARQLRRLGL
jgi:hypothetical protein